MSTRRLMPNGKPSLGTKTLDVRFLNPAYQVVPDQAESVATLLRHTSPRAKHGNCELIMSDDWVLAEGVARFGQLDVRRFEVAVDDALLVRRLEGFCYLLSDRQ